MWRVVMAGMVVAVVGCSTRTQVHPTLSRESCTPIAAGSAGGEEPPLFFIDGREASRDDLTGTCSESIDRIEVLKGRAAAKSAFWADASN